MGEVKRAWFGLPGIADPPTTTDDTPRFSAGRIRLDPLVDALDQARRAYDKAERDAVRAREIAEHYREAEAQAQRDLEEALVQLGILEREQPKEET